MKKTLYTTAITLFMAVYIATPVFAFDFVKGFKRFTQETRTPGTGTLEEKMMHYREALDQNINNFLYTHRGTSMTDYVEARAAAVRCNRIVAPGYVTDSRVSFDADGNPIIYAGPTISGAVDLANWDILYSGCGSSVSAWTKGYINIDGNDRAERLTVEIGEDLSTGIFFGWLSTEDGGEDAVTLSANIRDFSVILSRLQDKARMLLPNTGIGITTSGISQDGILVDTATGNGNKLVDNMWAFTIGDLLRNTIPSDDWIIYDGEMFVGYERGADGTIVDFDFRVVQLHNGGYELYERGGFVLRKSSSVKEIADSLGAFYR